MTPPDLTDAQKEKLAAYAALLQKWQARINLVGPATLADAGRRHFEDSIQIGPAVPAAAQTLYDLGSGAGFPGLVLAILYPDLTVTLIESDQKKCAFLQTVSRETGTKISIQNARIEDAAARLPPPCVVTARALAPLDALFAYAAPWIGQRADITFLFPKGRNFETEIDAARRIWAFEADIRPSRTEQGAVLLTLTRVRREDG